MLRRARRSAAPGRLVWRESIPPPAAVHPPRARSRSRSSTRQPAREGLTSLETIGHGCAFLDAFGTGRPDILLVGNAGAGLFRNRGDGTFDDVTATALPAPPPGAHFLGCAVADYDGDGRPDIL